LKTLGVLLVVIGMSLLSACASQSSSENLVAQQDESGMICQREQVQGSIIRQRVCRSPEQIEAEKGAADAHMEEARSGGTLRPSGQ